MKVLITGGAGYIGSTIAACCVDNGIQPVILDDFSTGLRTFAAPYPHYEGDIADVQLLQQIVADHPEIEAVIHCAAKIVVPESVALPLDYYENNVSKSIVMVRELSRLGVRRLILSSTASMYQPEADFMVDETSSVLPLSPYAASKVILERMLQDFAATGALEAIALRYFNPIGADPQGRCGLQNPNPTHALGKMVEAHNEGKAFTVTGVDWPTRDGSGLRDYIHVWDLAQAHVAALRRFTEVIADATADATDDASAETVEVYPGRPSRGYNIVNLGTGTGTTVFELVDGFKSATGSQMEVKTAPPRPGDVVGCASRVDKAQRLLGWSAKLSITEGVRDALRWANQLPEVLADEAKL